MWHNTHLHLIACSITTSTSSRRSLSVIFLSPSHPSIYRQWYIMWHSAWNLSVIKRLLCGKRMSHSTLHGFHYSVVIQYLRIGTSRREALIYGGWRVGGGFLQAHKGRFTSLMIMIPQHNLLYVLTGMKSILYLCLWAVCERFLSEDFYRSETTSEWTRAICWFDLFAGKSVAPLDLSHLWKHRWVALLLSALLLFFFMASLERLFAPEMEREMDRKEVDIRVESYE